MIEIPLQRLPNQELNMRLAEQNVTLHVYARGHDESGRMYLDVRLGSTYVQQGAPLLPRVGLLSTPIGAGFKGQFRLIDHAAKPDWQSPPRYTELGTATEKARFHLYYLTAEEDAEVEAEHVTRAENAAMAALVSGVVLVKVNAATTSDTATTDTDTDSTTSTTTTTNTVTSS